jgi:hypothetical protein
LPHLGRVRFQPRALKPPPNINANGAHSKEIVPNEVVAIKVAAIKILDAIKLQTGGAKLT